MRQRRETRPLSVNILRLLAKELGDLSGKTTLAHELIQNADDAKDESGRLCATEVTFDIKDDALIVSNDAVFRKIDFDRISEVASGSKRDESGDRTTGKFGIGFISVYQVTDRPEIRSAGQVYVFRPDKPSEVFIKLWPDPSLTHDRGTEFRLPWAFEDSKVRNELRASRITGDYIESFIGALQDSLPRAALFLRSLQRLELRHNGKPISTVTRTHSDTTIQIDQDGTIGYWRVFEGNFSTEAQALTHKYKGSLKPPCSDRIRVAVPAVPINGGLLFATLPTEQHTGLPFHINADFYSASDRKSIHFGDQDHPRSEWNRTAICTAASVVSSSLIRLRDMYQNDAAAFWQFLSRVYDVYRRNLGQSSPPLGVF